MMDRELWRGFAIGLAAALVCDLVTALAAVALGVRCR